MSAVNSEMFEKSVKFTLDGIFFFWQKLFPDTLSNLLTILEFTFFYDAKNDKVESSQSSLIYCNTMSNITHQCDGLRHYFEIQKKIKITTWSK